VGFFHVELGFATRDPALEVANTEPEAKQRRENSKKNSEGEDQECRDIVTERGEQRFCGSCCEHIFTF